jgi:putative hydrolase of the HAD superfamily
VTRYVPSLVLFDLDGVLVDYDRAARTRHLARASGCDEALAWSALFDSGLEARFDAGQVSTAAYLDELGRALGRPVGVELWSAARGAAMHLAPETVDLVHRAASHAAVGVLTNNGRLLVEQLPALLPPLFPHLHGRVLCSAALGMSKPDPAVYQAACAALGHAPASTLFLDDSIANVDGALLAGLRAEHVATPRELRRVLTAHALA